MSEPLVSFWDHLEDLKKTLIKLGGILVFSTLLCFVFSQPLLKSLFSYSSPWQKKDIHQEVWVNHSKIPQMFTLKEHQKVTYHTPNVSLLHTNVYQIPPEGAIEVTSLHEEKLLFLSPLEGFELVFRFSFWLAVALSSPFCLWVVFQFVRPGLYPNERKMIFPFIFLSYGFMGMGIAFAKMCLIPLARTFLAQFNESLGTNAWTFSAYFDFTFFLVISSALLFELGAILFWLVYRGTLTEEHLIQSRKGVVLGAFILGALATPPDIPSQLMMAALLLGLYEGIILFAKIKGKKATYA